MGDGNIFKDQELRRNDGDRDSFIQLEKIPIHASLRFIQEIFQGMQTVSIFLAAETLITHQSWPVGDRNLLLLHGQREIQELVDHIN